MTNEQRTAEVLDALYEVIAQRRGADPQSSYTARLTSKGRAAICQKLGEEATETIIAALAETPRDLIRESADLLYHLLVLWADSGVSPEAVWAELDRRRASSGLAEKEGSSRSG